MRKGMCPGLPLSGECPGPRKSTAGRLSRPDNLLGHLSVQERPHASTTAVSTALATGLYIQWPDLPLPRRGVKLARSPTLSTSPTLDSMALASSSRSQVSESAGSALALLTCNVSSVSVPWRPSLPMGVVTHLVTQPSCTLAMSAPCVGSPRVRSRPRLGRWRRHRPCRAWCRLWWRRQALGQGVLLLPVGFPRAAVLLQGSGVFRECPLLS
jgi:hypothetical protein